MEGLRQAVFTVVGTALACGILFALIPDGKSKAVLRFLCGLALSIAVLRPAARLEWGDLSDLFRQEQLQADTAASEGLSQAENAAAEIIKEKTEAYILDKAGALNAAVQVEVILGREGTPVPVGAVFRGNITPYARRQLESILLEDLGIAKEDIQWTGSP